MPQLSKTPNSIWTAQGRASFRQEEPKISFWTFWTFSSKVPFSLCAEIGSLTQWGRVTKIHSAHSYYAALEVLSAIETFCQLLFCHPYTPVATEAHGRLGIAFKCLENFPQSLKHLLIALDDHKESSLLPKYQIRFHIAHCYDGSGDFRRAVEEYRRLITDHDKGVLKLPVQVQTAVFRQLGWIFLRSREKETKEDLRQQKLKEAEQLLIKARDLTPTDSKTNCYLGLCYSEQITAATTPTAASGSQPHIQQQLAADKAQSAFVSYRSAIDSDESDANTWCSIGVLYQQQNQAIDALQAFSCAVQLDPKHSTAWTELGRLYESHRQYHEALHCFKKALQNNSVSPEPLKSRIQVLEKELLSSSPTVTAHLLQLQNSGGRPTSNRPGVPPIQPLPSLENAWQLGIPAQVRQRLGDIYKQQQNRYKEGSPLWTMSELAAQSMRQPFYELDPTQRQIMQVLKLNKEQLEHNELNLLRQLEERYSAIMGSNSASTDKSQTQMTSVSGAKVDDMPKEGPKEGIKLKIVKGEVTSVTGAGQTASTSGAGFPCLSQDDLEDLLGDTSAMMKTEIVSDVLMTTSAEESDNPEQTKLDKADDQTASKEQTSGEKKSKETESQDELTDHQLQEERISSTSNERDLPPAFSLLAPVNVPLTVTSQEVLEMCKKRHSKPDDYKPIFDEHTPPPRQPTTPKKKLTKDKLLLKTPLIVVENAREALTAELQNFCYNSPIALVHGLTAALKIDLSQFSTKSLMETAPEHEVEVRTQYKMPGDANLDHLGQPTWSCYSAKSYTTIGRYGQYQAESFRHSLKEETEKLRQTVPGAKYVPTPAPTINDNLEGPSPKRRKTAGLIPQMVVGDETVPLKVIKFGTNVDLSDEKKFKTQLNELHKMPSFCRISSASNLLTHLGHTVLGMNTVQLYMKVPGCRTPGHLENNSFASININIGPGECEWFGVPYEYWPVVEKMCKERNLDFLKGAWWPNFQDLIRAEIPCYRFTQKAGDMVWVGGGCVHWVQSTGWCNNVAWNVGPMTANQMDMALYAHEWNRLNTYRSLVPMQHLCWQLAKNVRFSNQKMFNIIKNMLIRSMAYCRMVQDFVEHTAKSLIKTQHRQKGETAHYCHLCEIEVFNMLFVKEIGGKFRVFCVQCARKNNLDDYVVLQQIPWEELCEIFDRFQLYPAKSALVC
ncbi:jmjC domain, hydroxylase domain-containing protein [Ditylenchus destructor]|uniref:JmjC domain, hydroxylase domain-containing protein n=1 Tax=Ditylenchus destructor TaxID=166010 RepID=A0AAD4R1K6_9BILA|nr:jmjC domain, hydroxylase domain-containing protein [Ditylenchus destructor]